MATTSNGIHFEITGDGPLTTVLLPGLGCSIEAWARVAPLLPGRRLVLLDLPGHAGSIASEADGSSVATITRPVLAALDELGLDDYTVVGLSFGATIGVRLAMERPDHVSAVMAFMPWPASGTTPGDPIIEGFHRAYGDTEAISTAVKTLSLKPEYTTDVAHTMAHAVSREFWDSWYGPGGGVYTSMFDELGAMSVPVSYVLAGRDAVAPYDQLMDDVRAIPTGRAVFLNDVGHLAPYEHPETVAREITDYLARVG